ncbi:hypothetical protein BH24DEI2_BH24DEI2_04780 [soil metagenome]
MRLLLLSYVLANSCVFGQLNVRGEMEMATDLSFSSVNQSLNESFGLTLRGHLEADYAVEPLDFRVVLDPLVRVSSTGPAASFVEPGLTEVFALYRLDDVDLSAGLERLPLETARLSVPFRLEPVNGLGQPSGLLGVRANVYLEGWRVRPALLYRTKHDRLGGVVSVRRSFGDFEIEGHVLYLDGFTVGSSGSGLVGDVVVYGEAWLLTNPWDGRGALGASGFWGDLLWTVEAAYAADAVETVADTNGTFKAARAYQQLLGQLSLPQGEAGNLDLNVRAGLVHSVLRDSSLLQTSTSFFYTHTESDYRLTVGPTFSHAEGATVYALRLGVTGFF